MDVIDHNNQETKLEPVVYRFRTMDDFLDAVALDKEFTPEQKEKIEELRERVRPELTPAQKKDSFLMRWLIARNYDVDRAEEMLKKHINFVKVNGLDNITENYTPAEIVDYFYTAMLGYDKDGSVVRLLNVGASDLIGLCSSVSKIDSLRIAYYLLAKDAITQRNERINETICEKNVYILDLEGLSWRSIIQRLVVNRAIALLKSYEANHPERLKIAYIVNAPSFFSVIYSWLKSILPESVLTKVEVVAPDQCEAVLTKNIDPSILPASIGGTRTDPDGDPNCNSLYAKPLGTPVPDELKLMNHHDALNNDPEAKKITVEYRALFIAEKLVSKPRSILQWDFQTVDYDIRMGLRYKKDEDAESVVIIPVHGVDCHLIPEAGQFSCEKPGIYELVFDNSYSWITSKELTFKVNLLMPDENSEN